MNIYKIAYVNRHGKQLGEVINYDTLDGVSTLLWEEGIDHECRLSADDGKLDELQIEVEKDTLDKLLKNYILDLD